MKKALAIALGLSIAQSLPVQAQSAAAAAADAPAPQASAAGQTDPSFDVYEYVIEGNTVLPSSVVERAVTPFMGPGRRFADLEQARAALEKAYQSAGYLSVLVSLPNQRVDGGEVRLEVVEAPVEKLRVTGSQYHLPSRIREAVPSLKAGEVPHFPQVQQELAALQSADLQITPLVNASESGQGIDVDLKVEDRPPVSGSIELNNGQSFNTTRGRVVASISTTNLFQRGHSLGLSWQYAPQRPKDSNSLSLIYGLPLSGRDDLLASLTDSQSDTLTKVSGTGPSSTLTKGTFMGLRWSRRLDGLNWPINHSFYAAVDYKHNRDFNTFVDGAIVQRPPTRYPLLSAGYSITHNGAGDTLTSFSTSIKGSTHSLAGRKVDCNGQQLEQFDCKRAGSSADFLAWQIGVGHGRPVFGNWRMNFSADLQLASGALPSGEQYSLGGPATVRGYFDYEQSGDQGWSTRAELVTPAWFEFAGIETTALVFADRGFVHLINPQLTQQGRTHLGSQGVGLRLGNGPRGLQVSIDVARVAFDTLRPSDDGTRQYASGAKADRRYRLDISVRQSF
ncbi:ShlB/FhaC/HecB family hemolysin secretion/activation protein [Aquabacterium soli]|nr:ShlB/FhaC/HecB family hemolysin secretion/activation protein [Aquabacterium soli]